MKNGGCSVHTLQEIRNNNTCHSIVNDDVMRFNLALNERRVLLYLQRSGPQDAEILADSLNLSLQKTKDAIQTLAEKDLVSTPDSTVADLTGSGESYNLMNDESLDETSGTMSRAMRKILACVSESPLQTSAIPVFCTSQGISIEECVKTLEVLESRGYPASDYIN
jgi:predicted transcriptional regulator